MKQLQHDEMSWYVVYNHFARSFWSNSRKGDANLSYLYRGRVYNGHKEKRVNYQVLQTRFANRLVVCVGTIVHIIRLWLHIHVIYLYVRDVVKKMSIILHIIGETEYRDRVVAHYDDGRLFIQQYCYSTVL